MGHARGLGRTMFAAVLLTIGGLLNIIYGIAAIAHSSFFLNGTHFVFAGLRGWGVVTLILGIFELLAALWLFRGVEFARWFAIVVAALVALDALLWIPAYPFLAVAIFALSLWIIQGLLIYGEPASTPVAGQTHDIPPATPPPSHRVA